MAVRLRPPARVTALAIVAAVVVALALLAAAIARYPGGNDVDRAARGFDPLRNYLSDLLHERGLGGEQNAGAPLARAAMLVFVAGLAPFFVAVSRRCPARPVLGRVVLAAGLLSVAAWLGVPLSSSDRFGALHGALILGAVVPGLVAAVAATVALARPCPRLAWLGAATLLSVALTVALYVPLLLGAWQVSCAVPALQKVCGALLVTWMLGVAWVEFAEP